MTWQFKIGIALGILALILGLLGTIYVQNKNAEITEAKLLATTAALGNLATSIEKSDKEIKALASKQDLLRNQQRSLLGIRKQLEELDEKVKEYYRMPVPPSAGKLLNDARRGNIKAE